MKILYVGNFQPTHSTETHVAATLERLGHAVDRAQENAANAAQLAAFAARGYDLFLWTRTWGIAGDVDDLLARLRQLGVPSASFHLDLYFGLARGEQVGVDPFWLTDFVFTPDGGHHDEFKARGVNHFYLKPGVFAPECWLAPPKRELSFNVVFVGSRRYHDEWPYRKQLLDWLQREYGREFAHLGEPGTKSFRGAELNALYSSARVAVGDSAHPEPDRGYYWSDRVYETLGRGGFIVHPRIEGLEEEFTEGVNIALYEYGAWDQLREILDWYLMNPDHRERVRVAGHELVKKSCTYDDRMREMLRVVGC